jgi:hypothetical protein
VVCVKMFHRANQSAQEKKHEKMDVGCCSAALWEGSECEVQFMRTRQASTVFFLGRRN